MAPPHRGGAAEPVVLSAGPGVLPGGGKQPSAGAKPLGDAAQQAGLLVERHVDEGVEADDGVEGTGREVQLGGICPDEGGVRDEPAGSLDLNVADVHAGHPVTGGCEAPGNRKAAAASDIEDVPAIGKM